MQTGKDSLFSLRFYHVKIDIYPAVLPQVPAPISRYMLKLKGNRDVNA
jgi:hypothetical protein